MCRTRNERAGRVWREVFFLRGVEREISCHYERANERRATPRCGYRVSGDVRDASNRCRSIETDAAASSDASSDADWLSIGAMSCHSSVKLPATTSHSEQIITLNVAMEGIYSSVCVSVIIHFRTLLLCFLMTIVLSVIQGLEKQTFAFISALTFWRDEITVTTKTGVKIRQKSLGTRFYVFIENVQNKLLLNKKIIAKGYCGQHSVQANPFTWQTR